MAKMLDRIGLIEILQGGRRDIQDQFDSLPQCAASISDVPKHSHHHNVLPNPETRVPLSKIDDDEGSTYINANFISGYDGSSRFFIATQGPLESTATDFWRMIWEYGVKVVVMATSLNEGGREKCCNYWPAKEGGAVVYHNLKIRSKRVRDCGAYIENVIDIEDLQTQQTHTLFHIWLSCWPDHGVPESSQGILQVMHHVRSLTKPQAGDDGPAAPIVVHCSAGIGRSGAFIAAYLALLMLNDLWRAVDIVGIVKNMRKERGGSVQTFQQYLFIHQVCLDYLTINHPFSMFHGKKPRETTLNRIDRQDFFGVSLRGSFPAFILSVHPKGLAASSGVLERDHVLAINGEDVTNMKHQDIVSYIQSSPNKARFTLISVVPF